ncbi:MAG: hypothetical protein ACOVJ8_02040 [Sediminibacterium sp.]|jgi:hypothetical protein
MAINKNHEFEDIDGIKCAIVEKNVTPERVQFLTALLSFNNYQVVVAGSPAPKAVVPAPAPIADGTEVNPIAPAEPEAPAAPTTFTVGVTDLTFNPTNSVFGRSLKTTDGHIVTLSYWQQKDTKSDDTIPYFEHK